MCGNFGVLERSPRGRFGLGDRILEHGSLSGAESGWESRITGGFGIISDPEVDAAVGGKENGVAGDEVIMNPAGRRSDSETSQQKNASRN